MGLISEVTLMVLVKFLVHKNEGLREYNDGYD
jgi:hypothetical protein